MSLQVYDIDRTRKSKGLFGMHHFRNTMDFLKNKNTMVFLKINAFGSPGIFTLFFLFLRQPDKITIP